MEESPAAIVTGGSSGIGLAIVEALLAARWRVLMVGRSASRLVAAQAALLAHANGVGATGQPAAPPPLELLAGDVAIDSFPAACVERAVGAFGRLDAIINNAGRADRADIVATTPALLRDVFAANTFGPALLIARAWPHLVAAAAERGQATIVNLSSMAAHDPFPGFFVYGASKSGLEGLTRAAAVEGRALGIRAFSVSPGAVETPMLRALFDERAVPASMAMPAAAVAEVVRECLQGRRESENGRSILLTGGGGGAASS